MSTAQRAYQETRSRQVRDELVLKHLDEVRHVLSRMAAELPAGLDRENLEGAGVLGLLEAAQRFDPAAGVDFGAYARMRIRGAMLDELRRSSPLSQTALARLRTVRQAIEQLPPPASIADIAAYSGLSPAQVVAALESSRWTRPEPLLDHHSRQDEADPAAAAIQHELQQHTAAAIENLPQRSREILTLYHLEQLRLREIGEVLHLSPSRVSRLLAEAEHDVREQLCARQLLS